MRIMIDGMNLQLRRGTGVAAYGRNLVSALRSLGNEVSILYGLDASGHGPQTLGDGLPAVSAPIRRGRIRYWRDLGAAIRPLQATAATWTEGRRDAEHGHVFPQADGHFNVPRLYLTVGERFRRFGKFTHIRLPEPIDIAHWTYPIPARIEGAKNVYTIHDMVQARHPELTNEDIPRRLELLARIAREGDHIVTVSEHARRDIMDILRLDAESVTNAYQSVRAPAEVLARSPEAIGQTIRRLLGDDLGVGQYFLFIGAIEPKKNLERLIRAYAAADTTLPLVIAGGKGWMAETAFDLIEKTEGVIHLNYPPRDTLFELLRGARALLFPSLYEGFGLPIVEAFLCGLPVLTANGHGAAEIAGDAAMLVDPTDVAAISSAIRDLAGADSDALRRRLIDAGHRRAERFAPPRPEADLEQLYRRLLD